MPLTTEPEACPDCGGSGQGPDRCDGPGDVYNDPCVACEGTGEKDGKRPPEPEFAFDDEAPF